MYQNNYNVPSNLWGGAIGYTRIDEDGKMWVGNGEYESQVNYCPVTGQKAPVQMKLIETIVNQQSGFPKTIKEYINE